jgi:hypothetical protein
MFRFVTKSSFIIGVLIGVFLAVLVKVSNRRPKTDSEPIPRPFDILQYNTWFKDKKLIRRQISFDSLRYGSDKYVLESSYLQTQVNVYCLVLVKSTKNANAVKQTWGKHCNKIQLLNITSDKMKIPIKRDKNDSLWVLLCKTLKAVPDDFQWILTVYDYTFVLVENLRLFLASLNPDNKYYLGHPVRFWSTIYNMGQAGYVLSRGSINALKQKFNETESCSKTLTYRNQEDYYLGQNLALLNITPLDTRDKEGLSTFHPYNLYHVFFPGEDYYKFSVYPHKCCSRYSIAFQAIEGDKMYTYYYLLYTVQLFRDGHFGNKLPSKQFTDDEVWKQFLKERNVSENITSEQYYKIWENLVDDPTSFAKHMKHEDYFDYA